MRLKQIHPFNKIRTEYWKKIPQSRADEAIKASKKKYSMGVYVSVAICS